MLLSESIFPWSLILLSLFSGAAAFIVSRKEFFISFELEKLPRNRILGIALGIFVLLWCASEAEPLVSDSMQKYLLPAALLCSWLGYMLLDFLFARALGGFLILLAHYYLLESFALDMPLSPIFSVFCFIMGTFGIVISGKPYFLRDIIRKLYSSVGWRTFGVSILGMFSICFALFGIFCLFKS